MPEPVPERPFDDDDFLFWRLANGDVSHEEFCGFESRLIASPDLRARYLTFMALESSLYESFAPWVDDVEPAISSRHISRSRKPGMLKRGAALALACGIGMASALHVARPREARDVQPTATLPAAVVPVSPPPLEFQYDPLAFAAGPQLAVVTQIVPSRPVPSRAGPDLNPVRRGTRLKAGTLTLTGGAIQLEFMAGATVRLEGPAELRLISPDSARLLSGRAAVRASEWAKGFLLTASRTAVVDLSSPPVRSSTCSR